MSFASPIYLVIAAAAALGAVVIAEARRVAMPPAAKGLILTGLAALVLAAGGITLHLPQRRDIAVMVDLSPSTRTAAYRDPAVLERRLGTLLEGQRYRRIDFGDALSEKTVFTAPEAGAILLFSDAQFDLPVSAPPVWVVVDPNLEHPLDASLGRSEARGDQIVVTVSNTGPQRQLTIGGTDRLFPVGPGTQVIRERMDHRSGPITVRLNPADAWPENDVLVLNPAPPAQSERWWVGDGAPASASWRGMQPRELPAEAEPYLRVGVVVLNNVGADAISIPQQERLAQFVRDLGGGLLIAGGNHAFAAGGYEGGILDAISPLASSPPQPRQQWIILVDSSGSMAGAAGANDPSASRWQRAAQAAARLPARLGPSDPVSIGNFARDLNWWSQSQSAAQTSKLHLPPENITVGGPTNLEPILRGIASQLDGSAQTRIVAISDADVKIDDPAALAALLRAKQARLYLLATADTAGSPLPQVATESGGQTLTQPDASVWIDAAMQLVRRALPDDVERSPAMIRFEAEMARLPQRSAAWWNRTWLKRDALELALGQVGEQTVPLAARWRMGDGQVAAAAFAMTPAEADALANLVAQPGRDPRFKIDWKSGSQLDVSVDAVNGTRYLNDLDLTLNLWKPSDAPANSNSMRIPQIGPGRYELSMPSPRSAMLARVGLNDRVLERFASSGRYAPEFDAIGNDPRAMKTLADRTGGAVVEPSQNTPIEFAWPKRQVMVVSPVSIFGAAMIAAGLILWKRR